MAPQREWFEKDYYQVLGVPESATAREITKRYRQLARELHPDTNPGNTEAEERFKEVSAAYDVLGDEAKRKEYDEARRLGASVGGFGPGGPGGGGGFRFNAEDLGDLGGLFGNVFGRMRGGPGPGGAPRGNGPGRGDDVEADLHLSFSDAAHGVTTTVNLLGEVACGTCFGSGARPGTAPTVCPVCAGRGFVDEDQGFFSFSQPCQNCGGRGSVVTDPCPTCRGRGTEVRPRDVKVRIPAGVNDGQRIRIKGRGTPGRNGGPPGDLYVRVHVATDPLFGRSGRDLTLTVPITFPEAALGTDLKVPTLEGEPVTVRIPAGTPTGKTFRVKGRGIETNKGKGNLLVTVEVAVPARLSRDERKAIETLAQLSTESPRDHLLASLDQEG
jgi:molecular chaperone DnaJ